MAAATFDIVLTVCLIIAGAVVAAVLLAVFVATVRAIVQMVRGDFDKTSNRSIFSSKEKGK